MTAPLSRWSAGETAIVTHDPNPRHGEREKGVQLRMWEHSAVPRSSIRASAADCKMFELRKLIGAVF